MNSRRPLLEGSVPWPENTAREYLERGYWRGVSLDSLLSNSSERCGDKLAIVCGPRRITYSELEKRVSRRAGGFWDLGLRAADCVVVQLPNCLEAVECYFALFRIGAVPVLALPGHRETEITGFIRHTQAKAYICTPRSSDYDFLALARRMRTTEKSLQHVVVHGEAAEFLSLNSLNHSSSAYSPPLGHEIALLQLSGGSTGIPKLIPRTHDDYLYSIETSARACGYQENTVSLIVLPLAHNFPLSSPGLLGCLSTGGTVVLCPSSDVETAFSLLHQERVTDVALVPPLAHAWSLAARARSERFPDLQVIQVGGAPLNPRRANEIRETFSCELQQVFGMAEGLVCNTKRDSLLEQILHTQGVPMSDADEICIVDDEDRPLPDGTIGHLLTRGPYTIRGYFRAPEVNQHAFTNDGFYRTGDLVTKRTDGYLVVQGRAKELINRGGEKISPAEVEHFLLIHPQVREVAVVGQVDSLLGERICAFIVPHSDCSPTRELFHAYLRESGLATFKMPDRIEFLAELPRTRVGKVDKKSLSFSSTPSAAPPFPQKKHALREELATLLEIEASSISDTANLLECGLDSIRIMILVERFREWGHEVSFVEIAEQPSLLSLELLLTPATHSATT